MSGVIFSISFLVCILGAWFVIGFSQQKTTSTAVFTISSALAFFLLLQSGSAEKSVFTVFALQGLAFSLAVVATGLKKSRRKA